MTDRQKFAKLFFGAFDVRGTLFIDGLDPAGNTHLAKIEGGCNARGFADLYTTNSIGFPGGIAVDKSDDIAIEDQAASTVYVYPQPVRRMLGAPSSSISLCEAGDAVDFALTRSTDNLFIADAGAAAATKYGYPAGGRHKIMIPIAGQPIGVAVTITEIP